MCLFWFQYWYFDLDFIVTASVIVWQEIKRILLASCCNLQWHSQIVKKVILQIAPWTKSRTSLLRRGLTFVCAYSWRLNLSGTVNTDIDTVFIKNQLQCSELNFGTNTKYTYSFDQNSIRRTQDLRINIRDWIKWERRVLFAFPHCIAMQQKLSESINVKI